MANVLTPAGTTHIAERESMAALTDTFDAFEFGQGNDVPSAASTRASLGSKIGGSLLEVAAGYPVKGDSDTRNDGRGADVWSWLCVVPEGTELLASNLIVTNYDGGAPTSTEPVLVHGDTVVSTRTDQVLYCWVNVSSAGAVTVSAVNEEGDTLPEQMATWRSRSLLMSGQPGAQARQGSKLTSRMEQGEPVWTAARIKDAEASLVVRANVATVTLRVSRRVSDNDWVEYGVYPLDVNAVMSPSAVRTDPRWLPREGYTFSHAWTPDALFGARRARLVYELTLVDSTPRQLIHEVDFEPV